MSKTDAPDTESPEWTEERIRNGVPFSALPDSVKKAISNIKRGPQKAAKKVPVSIRLSPDVVAGLRATGEGWLKSTPRPGSAPAGVGAAGGGVGAASGATASVEGGGVAGFFFFFGAGLGGGESSPWNVCASTATVVSNRPRTAARRERSIPGLPVVESSREKEANPDVDEQLVLDGRPATRCGGLLTVDVVPKLQAKRHPLVEEEAHADAHLTANGEVTDAAGLTAAARARDEFR